MNDLSSNSEKVKYAIFLPVKNGGKYIAAAIQSVLAQSYSNFQLVILENRSSDATLSIVGSFTDRRISVLESAKELGIYESWQRVHDLLARKLIDAEFCTIIGHDDVFYPNFLHTIDQLTVSHPTASLYQTHFNIVDEHGNIGRPCRPIPQRETYRDFFVARCWRLRDSFGTGYVFRVSDYLKVGGIPDLPLLLWSDDLLVMRLTRLAWKATAIDICFAYRLHSESTSGGLTKSKLTAVVSAADAFTDIIQLEFGDLISDAYGKASMGNYINNQVIPLRHFFGRYIYDASMSFQLEKLEILKLKLLSDAGWKGRYALVNKIERMARRVYYFYSWLRSK